MIEISTSRYTVTQTSTFKDDQQLLNLEVDYDVLDPFVGEDEVMTWAGMNN